MKSISEDIIKESNEWFDRNRDFFEEKCVIPQSTIILENFIAEYSERHPDAIKNALEIGCCYGYNLQYLSDRLGLKCYGIDPSDKAIEYGMKKYKNSNLSLTQMISNDLKFSDNFFDVVIIGFSLYITPRSIILQSISEANRVLKSGGFLCITDFDTPIKYQRVNKHNDKLPVYKEDYAETFLSCGYTLVQKKMYSHSGEVFDPDVQERISTQILFKEYLDDVYNKG